VALGVLVGALDNGGSSRALRNTLADQAVLKRLVKEGDAECDQVRERDEELEPEEDRKRADESSGANERSDESIKSRLVFGSNRWGEENVPSQRDQSEDGVDHTGDDEACPEVLGDGHTSFGSLCESEPEEAGDDTRSDE